jgi:glucose/arabinose dehydrogenase
MRTSRTTPALIAIFLSLALPACGSADEPAERGESTPTAENGSAEASARKDLRLKRVGSFEAPVYVAGAPGFPELLFVVEQPGRVVVLRNGRRAGTFLDLRSRVSYAGEQGLLSIAFPPDYRSSGRFYVYYTDNRGAIAVDEFKRRGATRAASGSRRPVISIPHPTFTNHNGGQLQFLGKLLFLGTGDGGSGGDPSNNAQNPDSLLGKLLRIDPRASGGRPYTIPSGNPFVGRPGRDEIYSIGLRNPFRFSFDAVTSSQPRIAIGDVGQENVEELDYTPVAAAAGANFGWDALEGSGPYAGSNNGTPDPGNTEKPIFTYRHSRGDSCTIIGGYVVRDRSLRSLYRRYVYADLCEGELRSLSPHLKRASGERKLGLSVTSPSSFGEDSHGRLYVTSLEGPVYRIVEK